MAKPREVCDRIRALRMRLDKSQAEFAALVGVSQANVSVWENAADARMPSCESFMQLGNHAAYPDNLWFWEQAGLDRASMLSSATSLLKQRMAEPPGGGIIAVPRLRKEGEEGAQAETPWLVDTNKIPNPGALAYWEGQGHGVLYRAGTRVLLDSSDNRAASLAPFWESVVLIESPASIGGIYLGELRLEQWAGHPDRHAVLCPWAPTESQHLAFVALRTGPFPHSGALAVGHWQHAMSRGRWERGETPASKQFNPPDRVRAEMQLLPGWTILGRALDLHIPME